MHVSIISGFQVNNAGIVIEVDHLRIVGIMYPGINVYAMPAVAQLRGKLPYINIHTAGVFGTQFSDRAGMNAKHGNAEWFGFSGVFFADFTNFSHLVSLIQLYFALVQRDFFAAQMVFIGFGALEKIIFLFSALDAAFYGKNLAQYANAQRSKFNIKSVVVKINAGFKIKTNSNCCRRVVEIKKKEL
jgi:hypothetical protein